ncbi:MAG: hypothetical protein WA196_01835 [Pseudolabrys sp.]
MACLRKNGAVCDTPTTPKTIERNTQNQAPDRVLADDLFAFD